MMMSLMLATRHYVLEETTLMLLIRADSTLGGQR